MSDETANLRFPGVLESDLGCEPNVGEIVKIEYLGVAYQARVTRKYADYDDWGNAMTRYDLEATGTGAS